MDEDVCCPRFDPGPWDGVTLEWNDKQFIKGRVFTLFYIPFGFGKLMRVMDEKVRNAGATIPGQMCLSDHTSKWNMDVYLAVDKPVPGARNVTLNGRFLCKVYEGPYKDARNWCRDFANFAKSQEVSVEKQYFWYTTCPKCAKKYGKNYTVIVGKTRTGD